MTAVRVSDVTILLGPTPASGYQAVVLGTLSTTTTGCVRVSGGRDGEEGH